MTQEVQPRTKILKNNAIYDLDKHRIVGAAGPITNAITSQNAAAMATHRQQLKRDRVVAGANAALAELEPDKWVNAGDLDFVEAISEAAMHKALNPDDPKQIDAARFLHQESGLAEAKQQEPQVVRHEYAMDAQTAEVVAGMLRQIEARQAELNLIDVKLSTPGEEGAE